jgi:F-type H+-transporting ATPase subunit gamma
MASTIALKRRISSVKNTRQITKAMELVSASKMRRAQENAKRSREYQELAYSLLARMSSLQEVERHHLFEPRKLKSRLYIVITSNSGLAGAYNANSLKILAHSILEDKEKKIDAKVITIGKKGAQFVRRLNGVELFAVYPAFGDNPTPNDIRPILKTILDEFRLKKVDEISIVFTKYKSNLVQTATSLSLLPASTAQASENLEYKYQFSNFEPSAEEVIDSVAERLLEVQLWQCLLESLASEHSMRMMAMKNASDNANDIIGDLTLEFNTARQAGITRELAEISGGVEALKD